MKRALLFTLLTLAIGCGPGPDLPSDQLSSDAGTDAGVECHNWAFAGSPVCTDLPDGGQGPCIYPVTLVCIDPKLDGGAP